MRMQIHDDEDIHKLMQKEFDDLSKLSVKYEKEYLIESKRSEIRRQKNEIRKLRKSNRYYSERRRKFTTTKLLMYLILLNCTIVEGYSMWVMFYLKDLSALYALIGAVIGESLSYAIYCAKAYNETKEEVKQQLERDKFNYSTNATETEPPELPEEDPV